MRVLLDTCTFLWIALDSPEISGAALDLFAEPENDVYLSAASAWEIAVKYALGKLPLPRVPGDLVPFMRKQHAIEELAIAEEAALHLVRIPALHKDPFDRMLVAQAIVHDMVILTPDERISQYPVKVRW